MNNGCPKCEKLGKYDLCLKCQLEQAEQDRDVAIKKVEEIKQKLEQEQKGTEHEKL